MIILFFFFFFFQAEDGIRDFHVTGVQTCALPIWHLRPAVSAESSISVPVAARQGGIGGISLRSVGRCGASRAHFSQSRGASQWIAASRQRASYRTARSSLLSRICRERAAAASPRCTGSSSHRSRVIQRGDKTAVRARSFSVAEGTQPGQNRRESG